jgi:hypothetical protein
VGSKVAYNTAVWVMFMALVVGCTTTTRRSEPPRTATEQLLLSRAVDHAVLELLFTVPQGTKVWVDASNFRGYDSEYAVSAIKEHLLRQGAFLVIDRAAADRIVEIRSGALSIDSRETFLGIPSFTIPIPLAGPFVTPELALYRQDRWQGIAKFAFVSYDAHNGDLKTFSGPVYGSSLFSKWRLLFIRGTRSNLLPEGVVE